MFPYTVLGIVWLLVVMSAVADAQQHPTPPLGVVLQRAGERVEQFFARAQTIISTETVRLQELDHSLFPNGFSRTVESELRLAWDGVGLAGDAPEARVERSVLRVNGRPPRDNDRNNCTVPEQRSTQSHPLSMLLPQQRQDYVFRLAGWGRAEGREAVMVEFREVASVKVDVRMEGEEDGEHTNEGRKRRTRDDCIGFDISGGMRGRFWIDGETYDVLRLDQRLGGLVDVPLPRQVTRRGSGPISWTLERLDTTMRFKAYAFEDPEEVLILPASTMTLSVMRGGGTPRLRTTTEYSNYLRMLTGGRLLGPNDAGARE